MNLLWWGLFESRFRIGVVVNERLGLLDPFFPFDSAPQLEFLFELGNVYRRPTCYLFERRDL